MSNTKSNSAKIAFALPHRSSNTKLPEIVFGESKTEQCHKDSCDINLIVAGALHNPAQTQSCECCILCLVIECVFSVLPNWSVNVVSFVW